MAAPLASRKAVAVVVCPAPLEPGKTRNPARAAVDSKMAPRESEPHHEANVTGAPNRARPQATLNTEPPACSPCSTPSEPTTTSTSASPAHRILTMPQSYRKTAITRVVLTGFIVTGAISATSSYIAPMRPKSHHLRYDRGFPNLCDLGLHDYVAYGVFWCLCW